MNDDFISLNISYLVEKEKLGQDGFGILFGLNRGTIGSYINGKARPKIEVLHKISEKYNILIDDIVKNKISNIINPEIIDKKIHPADRLLEFIDHKGITKYKFHKTIGASLSFLDKAKEIRSDNLRKIIESYPMIDLHWLLTGEGNMLIDANSGILEDNKVLGPSISIDAIIDAKIDSRLMEGNKIMKKLEEMECLLNKIFIGQTIQTHKKEDILTKKQETHEN